MLEGEPLPIGGSIALVLALVGLNGFFVASEFAIVRARESRMAGLARGEGRRAKLARTIVANVNAYVSACRLGMALTTLGLGWIAGPAVARLLEPVMGKLGVPAPAIQTVSFFAAFACVAGLLMTIGEQYPKAYGMRKPEPVALWAAAPLLLFYRLARPLLAVVNKVGAWLLGRAGIEPDSGRESVHTEEDIRTMVKESHRNGLIDKTELTMVEHVFAFTEMNARKMMIPRTEMVCLYAHLSYEDNKRIAVGEKHTRYPVCDPDKDNVVGFVHIKDILRHESGPDSIMAITRPLMKVPDSMPVSALLGLMQRNRTEMALLIDEYGGTSGLVTIEDMMEKIVGDIHDEFDEGRPRIEKRGPGLYSLDGLLLIGEVNGFFGIGIETDNCDTIGGWMYAQVGTPPRPNESAVWNGFEFAVEEVDHMRISRLLVRIPDHCELPSGLEAG